MEFQVRETFSDNDKARYPKCVLCWTLVLVFACPRPLKSLVLHRTGLSHAVRGLAGLLASRPPPMRLRLVLGNEWQLREHNRHAELRWLGLPAVAEAGGGFHSPWWWAV